MPKKCKSSGEVAIPLSGERSRNTLATCPEDRDNVPKGTLIPDVLFLSHGEKSKARNRLREGLAAYQLVGEVTAYQGDDG